jgi:glucose-1-phosphate adenylyltransferase
MVSRHTLEERDMPDLEQHPDFVDQTRRGSPDTGRFVSQLTKRTFAVVLAGGRGSRLRQLTDERCKPAVPFAGKFRVIDFTLSNCVNSGIRRIGVATQYKAHSLIRHIQHGWSFLDGRFDEFIELLPAQQQLHESWYRGTADAVYQNIGILRRHNPDYVLVLAGDHVYKMDYGKMLAFHVNQHADATVGCVEVPLDEARALGVMKVDSASRVVDFAEKPARPEAMPGKPDTALASMGIYLFNADFLYEQLIRDADDPKSKRDFGRNVIPHIAARYRVYAQSFSDSCVGLTPEGKPYWRDVGTVDAYWKANIELTDLVPELNLYDHTWPIWTYQEQLPPAKFVFDEDERRGCAVHSLVSGGCIVSGGTVRHSLLFSGVRVNEHSVVEDSVVLPGVDIGRNVVIRRSVIDRGCSIADDMQIGVDGHADRGRFHVTDQGITLVTPGMLGQPVFTVR